jgi:hypothetical protein
MAGSCCGSIQALEGFGSVTALRRRWNFPRAEHLGEDRYGPGPIGGIRTTPPFLKVVRQYLTFSIPGLLGLQHYNHMNMQFQILGFWTPRPESAVTEPKSALLLPHGFSGPT